MNLKLKTALYYSSTALLTLVMLYSAGMYFFKYPMVEGFFNHLGYPTYLIYPLAIAKLLGLVAIWNKKYNALREWAYAGFFYNIILAFYAHLHAHDGAWGTAGIALVLLIISYSLKKPIVCNT